MGQAAAKQGDRIEGTDSHLIVTPAGATIAVTLPFSGPLSDGLSNDVRIMGRAAATLGSGANNTPPHVPTGGSFQTPPSNKGSIVAGSATVRINGKPAARSGDTATTCNDPADLPIGRVVADGPVSIG